VLPVAAGDGDRRSGAPPSRPDAKKGELAFALRIGGVDVFGNAFTFNGLHQFSAAADRQPTIIFRAGEAAILPYRSSASRLK
jgi:hypothetical protein